MVLGWLDLLRAPILDCSDGCQGESETVQPVEPIAWKDVNLKSYPSTNASLAADGEMNNFFLLLTPVLRDG